MKERKAFATLRPRVRSSRRPPVSIEGKGRPNPANQVNLPPATPENPIFTAAISPLFGLGLLGKIGAVFGGLILVAGFLIWLYRYEIGDWLDRITEEGDPDRIDRL